MSDGSCSVWDIQDYFEYILKEHGGNNTDNPWIRIYKNKIKNRITFKTKTGYLKLLMPEIMKLLGSSKR